MSIPTKAVFPGVVAAMTINVLPVLLGIIGTKKKEGGLNPEG